MSLNARYSLVGEYIEKTTAQTFIRFDMSSSDEYVSLFSKTDDSGESDCRLKVSDLEKNFEFVKQYYEEV